MRKILLGLTVLLFSVFLSSCGLFEGDLVKFTNLSNNYRVKTKNIRLYDVENSDSPYIDIQSFIKLLDGAILSDEFEFIKNDNELKINFEVDYGGADVYIYTLDLDFDESIINVSSSEFFDIISYGGETNYGYGLETIDFISTDAQSYTIDLKDYGFKLAIKDDKWLMPFSIANLFFSGSMYDVYYNGRRLYGIDTNQLMSDYEDLSDELLRTSPTNATMTSGIKRDTVNFMKLVYDYFYGLYDEFGDFFNVNNYPIDGASTELFYDKFFYESVMLDDLHTSFIFTGHYGKYWTGSKFTSADEFPPRIRENYYVGEALGYFDESYYTEVQYHRDVYNNKLNTAFIMFDEFSLGSLVKFEKDLDKIKSQGDISNVVIDLTVNGGGNLGVVLQILGYITEDTLPLSSKSSIDLSTSTTFMTSANDALDYNWYILTSELTFSAANLLTSLCKENNWATIIGHKSGGGASSVTAIFPPDGSALVMSSTYILTDSNYNSLEYGITPDYYVNNVNVLNQSFNVIKTINNS